MKITLVCSCGLLLEHAGGKLLIDGITVHFPPFYTLPESEFEKLLAARAPYDGLNAVAFTHLHPDHFSSIGVRRFESSREHARVFLPPAAEEYACIEYPEGGFTVEFFPIHHTPVPAHLMVPHFALLITAGEKTVYVTADAEPNDRRHGQILQGRKVDVAFWNSQHLSYAPMRMLMREKIGQNYIYHLPAEPDPTGMRRKCQSNLDRFAFELPNVKALGEYPSVITL